MEYIDRIFMQECIEGMSIYEDQSIDMILCDMPYGMTDCKWDSVLDLKKLWQQYERIIKDNGAIVLTAAQPFIACLRTGRHFTGFELDPQYHSKAQERIINEIKGRFL